MRILPTAKATATPMLDEAPVEATASERPADEAPATATAPQARTWPGQAILEAPETAAVMHSAWSGDPAVVVPSPPGAGKTRLVALLAVALAHRAEMRIGVAAQTREQAIEIARRIGGLSTLATLMWKAGGAQPEVPGCKVAAGASVRFPPQGGGILIGTTARWLFARPDVLSCDLLIVDEAWQATYADLGALGAFASQVVCVGDPGQIDPVVTGNTDRWRERIDAPNLPAPEALIAAHGEAVSVVSLRHTWRLGPATTALIQPAFYPSLPFTSRRPPEHISDQDGRVLPELAHQVIAAPGGPSDPALTAACADRARDLLGTTYTTSGPDGGDRAIEAGDLAVVCAHVSQAAAVRARLADLPDVLVGTANQLQGLERPAVVALHPLAGYRDASAFTADTGRACVMLSRHRSHLSLIIDAATPDVLAETDPGVPGIAAHSLILNTALNGPTI